MAMNTAAFSHHLQTQLSPGVISLLKWTPRGNCKTSFLHFTTLRGTRACSRLAAAGLLESSSSTTAVVLLTPVFYEWHESLGWKLRLHLNFVGGQKIEQKLLAHSAQMKHRARCCMKISSIRLRSWVFNNRCLLNIQQHCWTRRFIR